MSKKTLFLFLAILAIAVFFRLWNLTQIPPGLYPDVALNGTNALEALKTHDLKVFYPDNNGREGLFINIIALSIWLLGPSVFAIKLVAAIFGILTVVGFFFFARNVFGFLGRAKADFIALLGTFFLSVGFWHLNFSRLGFRAILVPFILVWSFYLIFKALEATQIFKSRPDDKNKKIGLLAIGYWLLAGLFFGLGFHTYISFRVAPLILLPLLFFTYLVLKKNSKENLKKTIICWVIFFIFVAVAAAPIGYYFLTHPQDFIGRAGQVSVFSSENPLKAVLVSSVTLGMFNVYGDCNWRHNNVRPASCTLFSQICQPMLLWPVGIFFLIGLIYAFFEAFRPKNWRGHQWQKLNSYWILIFMFFVMLLPAILSTEGLPHALRTIGAIPAVFVFAGFGLALLYLWLKRTIFDAGRRPRLLFILLIITLLGIGCAEFNKYFLDWGTRQETKDEFTQKYIDIGNYLNSLPKDVTKYILINENGVPVPYPNGIPMPAQTIVFITHRKADIKYLVPSISGMAFINKGLSVLIPLRYDAALFNQLKQQFPQGTIETIQNKFTVLKIGF
jgi:hypothetical protein